jgi:predicted PurR-regulated permease PerM
MEFFLPGIIIFISAIILVYSVAPSITPFITAILSIIFLSFGVYTHYQIFASEYRLSTWQEGLKMYAPAVMIITVILFIIYSIVALFTNISVPIPSMPNIEMPSTNSITNSVMNSYNSALNSVSSATNSLVNSVKNSTNSLSNNLNSLSNSNNNSNNNSNSKKNRPNISRSFVETF